MDGTGLEGEVFGESVPSSSGVVTTGPAPEDYVVNVFIDERNQGYWLAPENLELLGEALDQGNNLDRVLRWVREGS